MELLINPFKEPELIDALFKTAVLLLFGLLVMAVTQIKNLKRMASSLAFKKFCSWIIISPCLLIIVYSGRIPFITFVLFLLWQASSETLRMMRIPPFYRKVFWFNQVITAGVMILRPEQALLLPVFYVLFTFLAAGIRNQMHYVIRNVASSIVGSIWIGFFLALLVLIYHDENGRTLVTVILGMVVTSDVFAFLFGGIGRRIGVGNSPLATNISPNKVTAGVFGNVFGALISYLMFGLGLGYSWWLIAVIVVLSGIGAAYGDLAESMLKRTAAVKASSNLIPFHGGMMDRIDSLLFVIPTIYLVIKVTREISALV